MDSSLFKKICALALASCLMLSPVLAQTPANAPAAQQPPGYTVRVTSDLVLVNVVARDKGTPVRDLAQNDFTILEDGKPQRILTFDFETPGTVLAEGPSQATVQGKPEPPKVLGNGNIAPEAVRDRRLLVVLFDVSSMQPDEIRRAIQAANNYVEKQMTPADLVSLVTLGNSMQVLQDFTSDRAALKQALNRMSAGEGQGFEAGTTGDAEGQPDTGQQFTVDDTEYNLFNTDRRLQAIASLAQALARIEQKKSLLYFSSGMQRTGVENQSQLRAAINAAVRANVALYTVDIRGLEALPPGGGAQVASLHGTSAYSGKAVQNDLDTNFASQETLSTLAADTGGKAFLDSNDFGKAFTKVQEDTAAYYVLGYRSTNKAMDGRYRHISVRVNRRDLKLECRSGYYGPRDFQHFTREDREQQLEDEIASESSVTDLPIYVSTAYFRMQDDQFFVPVAVVVPGSALAFTNESDKATLDVLGAVRDKGSKLPVGSVRDTVKLPASAGQVHAVPSAAPVRRKNLQYSTAFTLPPGSYHLKFVIRENRTGRLGSFETDFTVPDLRKVPLKMSSIIVATQRVPNKQKQNPLVRDGSELVPNIAHVFSTDQPLVFYYEVYDAAKDTRAQAKPGIRLLTSIQFFSGKVKAYETPLVEARELNLPERKASAFQFEVPLTQLHPGWYTCQVNVIDDAGGTFSFPRLPLLIREAPGSTTAKY